MTRSILLAAAGVAAFSAPVSAQVQLPDDARALAREIFAELVEIPSVSGTEATVEAAQMLADRLYDVGYTEDEVRVISMTPRLGNLVARLEGSSDELRPIMLMAHLDVVPALPEAWREHPYTFLEQDEFFLGRGVADNKAGAAMLVANLIRYKQEGFVPLRDVVVVITGDEEIEAAGIKTLVSDYRDLVDAEYALNTDAGGGALADDGRMLEFGVQASEKMYTTFHMTTRNSGGHSSRPRPDNAIYQLAAALTKISEHTFPVTMDEVTRGYFRQGAALEEGQMAADWAAVGQDPPDLAAAERIAASDPYLNAVLRTTCVATRLQAGHADNALPRGAQATVNCRAFPGVSAESVQAELERVVGDPDVHFSLVNTPTRSPASPLRDDVMGPLRELVDEFFGEDVPIIPTMSAGATDGNYTRNAGIPTYGVSAVFGKSGESNAHGLDEKVRVKSFYEATQFWYHMVKRLSSPSIMP